jgi:hypothetical protein
MTQKEKLRQFLEALKNDDKLLNDFIERVDKESNHYYYVEEYDISDGLLFEINQGVSYSFNNSSTQISKIGANNMDVKKSFTRTTYSISNLNKISSDKLVA